MDTLAPVNNLELEGRIASLERQCSELQSLVDSMSRCIAPGTQVRLKTGLEAWVDSVQIKDAVLYEVVWQEGHSLRRDWVSPWMIEDLLEPNRRTMHLFTLEGAK